MLIGGRAIEQGQAVAAIISAAGCEAHFQPTDLTKLEDCAALIAKADEAFGRLDAVIFSAGMVPRAAIRRRRPSSSTTCMRSTSGRRSA